MVLVTRKILVMKCDKIEESQPFLTSVMKILFINKKNKKKTEKHYIPRTFLRCWKASSVANSTRGNRIKSFVLKKKQKKYFTLL